MRVDPSLLVAVTVENDLEVFRTSSGALIQMSSDIWTFRNATRYISINFNNFPPSSPELIQGVKRAIAWYLVHRAESTAATLGSRLLHFFRHIHVTGGATVDEIKAIHLLNYRATLNQKHEWYLSHIAGALRRWALLQHPGIAEDALKLLSTWALKGNKKGVAVKTADPIRGAFTEIEWHGLRNALEAAYTNQKVSLEDYLLTWLVVLLGQRPSQYALLKVCDVMCERDSNGKKYFLRVPRVKQRKKKPRAEFTTRVLLSSVGELLIQYASQVQQDFAELIDDASEAPLFPAKTRGKSPRGFEYHRLAADIGVKLKKLFRSFHVHSERTGQEMDIAASRFRRTVGTRAAEEGYGELVIADLLDHSDTQSVGVYVEATAAFVSRLDRGIALQMAPLAQAFAGVLIKDESEALRNGDPSSRIIDPRFDEKPSTVGNCGKFGFCGSLSPIACYTCVNFQPWLDGPHEKVLEKLLDERERLLASDVRIAAINDRTILAVAEVVTRCAVGKTGAI